MESPASPSAPNEHPKANADALSDGALLTLLRRLKTATAQPQIQDLSAQIERQILHRQIHSEPRP